MNNKNSGFSLVELLVAIAIFAVLGVITTQSLANTLKNTRKADSTAKVRENVEYSLSNIERLLRNAERTDSTQCAGGNSMSYMDKKGGQGRFRCLTASGIGYIASGSADIRITSTDVNIDCTQTSFVCVFPVGAPPSVTIQITARAANVSGLESAEVVSRTQVLFRNY